MNVLLWGKEDRIWDTLLDWKELRERLPLIYLSLHQLKNVKTVVLDQQKEVLGYVEQVENKF
ncbi:MAG: hypothetical protein LBG52_04080 [Candidatus Peribacteria bacterium]|jgi:hypothetical protein|nr:hypothetical protein [Candidatus Peribacteria bacterium]